MEYIHHYESPLGGITIASDGNALTGLWFDGQKYFADGLDKDWQEKALPIFEQTEKWLNIYFSGKEPDFTPLLKMKTTPFHLLFHVIVLSAQTGALPDMPEESIKKPNFYPWRR